MSVGNIKRLLIVPAAVTLAAYAPNRQRAEAPGMLRRLRAAVSGIPEEFLFCGEVLHYAEMVSLLGAANVLMLGQIHPAYFDSSVRAACTHPSCRGTPRPTFVSEAELGGLLAGVDAAVVSVRGGARAARVLEECRARGILVAMIDFFDHEEAMDGANPSVDIYRGFLPGRDFAIFFKKELTANRRTSWNYPLAPVPVRPSSYRFRARAKLSPIYYSGRPRPEKCQPERAEVVDAIIAEWGEGVVARKTSLRSFDSVQRYWERLDRAWMALSPSGRVWDSFRHCEIGLSGTTLLVAPRPYVETMGPPLVDGHNALLYETECRAGRFHLKDREALMQRLRDTLRQPDLMRAMAARWQHDILAGHTLEARARYILETMSRHREA